MRTEALIFETPKKKKTKENEIADKRSEFGESVKRTGLKIRK